MLAEVGDQVTEIREKVQRNATQAMKQELWKDNGIYTSRKR